MPTISTRTHGIADYAFAAATLALIPMHHPSRGTRALLTAASLATLGVAMLTRYELGVWKVLPMKAHLAADAVLNALFLTAPAALPRRDRAVALAMLGMGAAGSALAAMTARTSPLEAEEESYGARTERAYGDGYGYGDDDEIVAIGI